jgi:cysteine synthase
MAIAAIARAEEDGRLEPGDTVVEYTGGSAGASLALVCAVQGCSIRVVSSTGVARALRGHNPECEIVAVEPAESTVLSGGHPGVHGIEGVGIGFLPPLWDKALVDRIVPVSPDSAKTMARRLAREEGLFAGTSSGANVCAAIEIAKERGPDSTVVTLMIDSGFKYLRRICTPIPRARGKSRGRLGRSVPC